MAQLSRRQVGILLLLCAGWLGLYAMQWIRSDLVVEDAAISFAYARNLAEGEGLVALPGGERIEGSSTPLGVLLLAVPYKLGISPFTAARSLGALLGVLCLPLTFALTRQARPGGRGDVALLAAALLAASSQHLIWSGTGLEGGLFGFLLLAALVRMGVELDRGGRPWSALLFFLLCITRPEAPAYTAFAGLALWVHRLRRGQWRGALGWSAAVVLPLIVYHGLRIAYFAWPFPNTYYAKLGREGVYQPFGWSAGGWRYIRDWFTAHRVIWAVPLLALAMVGASLRRGWLLVLGPTLLAWLITWDPGQAAQLPLGGSLEGSWITVRVWAIPIVALSLAATAAGQPGARTRALLWANAAFGIFFALYSGGDWMAGHRWFGMIVLSLLPLVAIGVGEALDAILGFERGGLPKELTRGAILIGLLAAWGVGEWRQAAAFVIHPPISVADVARRVRYMAGVRDKLDLDQVVLADVDMGAHLWYAPRWEILDYAGLVDIPIGRRSSYPRDFVERYLFDEHRPAFFHIHGGWSDHTHIWDLPQFYERYIELPPLPTGDGGLHHGHFVDKALFVEDTEGPPADARRFAEDIAMDWIQVRSPEIAPGTAVTIESAWQVTHPRGDFAVVAFVEEVGELPTAQAPHQPGWEWYPPSAWLPGEEVIARTKLSIPEGMPLGTHRIGIVVQDLRTGLMLTPTKGEGSQLVPAQQLLTEVQVEVVSPDRAEREAELDRQRASELLAEHQCEEAWRAWKDAAWHLGRTAWADREMLQAMASCYATRAADTHDQHEMVASLVEGLRWDHSHPALLAQALPLAALLDKEGDLLAKEGDWDGAFEDWDEAVHLDPGRSWTRRKAEQARDQRAPKHLSSGLVDGNADEGVAGGWWAQGPQTDEAMEEEALRLQALGYVDAEVEAPATSGVTTYDRSRASRGVNLVLSTDSPAAELLDMKGHVLHRWSTTVEAVWPNKEVPGSQLSKSYWRRARLLAGGDLLAIFEQIGLVRLSPGSDVQWALPAHIHHDVEILPDGDLLALAFMAQRVSAMERSRSCVLDHVLRLGMDGKIKRVVSELAALGRSPWSWFLSRISPRWGDLFHSNDIAVLDEASSARLPGTSPGQVLVSLRNRDALIAIDLDAGQVTHVLQGPFHRQHDPELLSNGEILLFDNGVEDATRSRAIQLDPASGLITWSYGGDDGHPLHSRIMGEVQRLPNGNTLITESVGGRAIEVTPEGETVWEYVNPRRGGDGDRLIAMLPQVERLPCSALSGWLAEAAAACEREGPGPSAANETQPARMP